MGKKKKKIPPCPDPTKYILVNTKEGSYWRLKRGMDKPAVLNKSFSKNAGNTKLCMDTASAILARLVPSLAHLEVGRRHARIAGLLRKSLNRDGKMNYSFFDEFELQKGYPLGALMIEVYTIKKVKDMLYLDIPLAGNIVRRKNRLVTEYYFEAVLLVGDPNKKRQLRAESEESEKYSFSKQYAHECKFMFQIPSNKPWMLMLKVSCMEGHNPGVTKKLYGMKVLATGQ